MRYGRVPQSFSSFKHIALVAVCFYFCQSLFALETNVSTTITPVSRGVVYIHKQVSNVPWSIHILKAARGRGLRLETTVPQGGVLGLSPTTEQIKFLPSKLGTPIGAINGDFFSWRKGPYQGDPMGLQITRGELISAPHTLKKNESIATIGAGAFWVNPHGDPQIGTVKSLFKATLPGGGSYPFRLNQERTNSEVALYSHIAGTSTRTTNGIEVILEPVSKRDREPLQIGKVRSMRVVGVRGPDSPIKTNTYVLSFGPNIQKRPNIRAGDVIKISTETKPSLRNVNTAIGGGPLLVQNSKALQFKDPQRNPRSAFGFDNKYYYFVVVDGRRKGISDGMTFQELANEMSALGCSDAINLDGGGSAMLWVNGEIKNQPSDNKERPCANALVLMKQEDRWKFWRATRTY